MKKYHMNKMDISSENFWLREEEGREGGENKDNLGWMKQTIVRFQRRPYGITWREGTPVEKD